MQRVKDWMSGNSTAPSVDPTHSPKDDLKHAAHDLKHAKDDLAAQAKDKAHELQNRAHSFGRDVQHDARQAEQDAKNTAQGWFRSAPTGGDVRGAVRETADDARDAGREFAGNVRAVGREVKNDAYALGRDVEYKAAQAKNDAYEFTREAREKGQDVAQRVDAKAQRAKDEISADARYVANNVERGLRDARDTVIGSAVLLEDKVEEGFDRLSNTIQAAGYRARAEMHELADDARQVGNDIKQQAKQVQRQVQQRVAQFNFFERDNAPWYKDVGHTFDGTFNQPILRGQRIAITTPNLLSVPSASWTLSHVHECSAGVGEQVASNFSWAGRLFDRPVARVEARDRVTGQRTAVNFQRPIYWKLNNYVSIPMAALGKPTARVGIDIRDVVSNCLFGATVHAQGASWKAGFSARVPYVALNGVLANDGQSNDRVEVSGGVGATVFTDAKRNSAVLVGVQAKSTKWNLSQSSAPSDIKLVTAKVEYEEPTFNVDASLRVRNYTKAAAGQQAGFNVSSAHVRGLYVIQNGLFAPRTVVGVSAGLADAVGVAEVAESASDVFRPYADPDERGATLFKRVLNARGGAVGQALGGLDQPVASVAVVRSINAFNRLGVQLTSTRDVAATFTYKPSAALKIQTGLTTRLASWNLNDVGKPGMLGKPQLGLAVSIGAF